MGWGWGKGIFLLLVAASALQANEGDFSLDDDAFYDPLNVASVSPPCSTQLTVQSILRLAPANRYGQRLSGRLASTDGRIWFFPEWAEPFLVAEGTPLLYVKGVYEDGSKLILGFL